MLTKLLQLVTVAALLGLGAASALGQPPATSGQVRLAAEQAVAIRQQTQRQLSDWAQRQAGYQDQIEALERELAATSGHRKKTEAYLASQKAAIADMERRLKESERIAAELEPLLDQTLARLQAFVQSDLPFLAQERADRLAELSRVLNDYNAGLPLKTRRLLEALRIEAEYGLGVDLSDSELELEGARRRVHLLRLGRLAWFALSLDGDLAWRYQRDQGRFLPLSDYRRQLDQAAEMAARRRVVSLVEIPLGLAPAGEASQ